jgi:hypothetical protein
MKRQHLPSPSGPYEPLMLVLCVWVLIALAAETFLPLAEETRQLLQYANTGIYVVFLLHFVSGSRGTLTAFVASWFLEPQGQEVDQELDDVRAELRAIRAILEQRSTGEQRSA